MGLEALRARLDRLLSGAGSSDRRTRSALLHDALIDLKVALGESKDALAVAERELAVQARQLQDAERRGRLAREISDAETERVAAEFAAKHQERAALLTRKIELIKDELAYVQREYESLSVQLKSVRQGGGGDAVGQPDSVAVDQESERELDALSLQAEREAKAQAVQQQLDLLKKKLGKKQ